MYVYLHLNHIEPRSNAGIQTYLIIVHVLASFLPLKSCHLYLPFLYRLWEALNSHVSLQL
jgi:hypothetical protein